MAIILQDSFVGSAGDMDGRTPDTTFATLNWVTDPGEPINLDGTGAAQSADQSVVDARGFADVGLGGTTDYGLPTGVTTTITFVVKTGASVTQGSTAYEGFALTVEAGETTFGCGLFGPTSGSGLPWQVNEEAFGDDDAVTTPAINTEYTGIYEIADGAQTLTFMGNTINSTVAFVNPALGVNRVSIKVGAGFKLMSILVEDDAAIPMIADLTAPMGTLVSSTGARASLDAPMGLMFTEIRARNNEFAGIASMGTLNALTGATAALEAPMGTLVASVTVPVSVAATLTSPMGALVASGTVGVAVQANLMLTSSGALVAQAGSQAALAAPMGALQAAATAGVLARFVGGMPMGELSAMATGGVVVNAALVSPMLQPVMLVNAALAAPMGALDAYAEIVVAVTYEAYAVNLKPFAVRGQEPVNEVTRYTNFPFNQVLRFKNTYLGLADDGLYVLGGPTDAGDQVSWAWKTAMSDSGTSYKKTVLSVYFGGRIGQESVVTLYKDESDSTDHSYTTPRDASPKNHRQKLGRGTKTRYFALGVTGETELDLDTMEFEINNLTRRI